MGHSTPRSLRCGGGIQPWLQGGPRPCKEAAGMGLVPSAPTTPSPAPTKEFAHMDMRLFACAKGLVCAHALVSTCVCIHMPAVCCIDGHTRVHLHMCPCLCGYIRMLACVHTHVHTYMGVLVHGCICMCFPECNSLQTPRVTVRICSLCSLCCPPQIQLLCPPT